MKRIRVALIASADSSFVQTDRRLLRERFLVRDVWWRGKQSIPGLAWAVLRSDVTFSWFALDHAYGACRLARLFGRASVVFVGGVDAAKRPDLNYGVHLDPRKGKLSRYAMIHSDRVIVVDERLRGEIARNAGVERTDILTVNLGFDTNRYAPDGGPKANVLTIGIVDDVNVRRKGIETFVQAARLLPDLPFVLVGGRTNPPTERLRSTAPPNLRIMGRLSEDELLEELRRARVYVQISEYEAFGSALGEAMACGCVPVGTQVGGIPTLIGDTGPFVPVRDVEATVAAIRLAYASGNGSAARARIVERFSLDRRRRALFDVIEGLSSS